MSDNFQVFRDSLSEPLWENWYIKEEIGRGASSVVYRIEASLHGRVMDSALKMEPIIADPSLYFDEDKRLSYLEKKKAGAENEAAIMYRLRFAPNIVRYEDEAIKPVKSEGKLLGYCLLIRMEHLSCVQKMMKDHTIDLSEENILKLADDIGRGLKAAHDIGVIHRDVKPANFFATSDGTYKLGDFNISKKSVSTRSFAGTEGYIAPEIYRAKYSFDNYYTKQADIYSFGISLYCLMNSYSFPFADTCLPDEAITRRMDGEKLPPPKNASPEFARIILKACEYAPEDRYLSMDDMLADIAALRGTAAPPPASPVSENKAAEKEVLYDPGTQLIDDEAIDVKSESVSQATSYIGDDDAEAPSISVIPANTVFDKGSTLYEADDNPFSAPQKQEQKKKHGRNRLLQTIVSMVIIASVFMLIIALMLYFFSDWDYLEPACIGVAAGCVLAEIIDLFINRKKAKKK